MCLRGKAANISAFTDELACRAGFLEPMDATKCSMLLTEVLSRRHGLHKCSGVRCAHSAVTTVHQKGTCLEQMCCMICSIRGQAWSRLVTSTPLLP